MAKKWTDASDDKADRRARIKENSARDKALDKKRGVPEDDKIRGAKPFAQAPGGTGRTTGIKLKPAVARGAGVASRRQTSPQSLDGVGARVPNVISKALPPNIQQKSKKGRVR